MGGKSSKQKVKITKAEGGKQTQGKTKEQKERVENGETATDKSAHNEMTTHETEDNNTNQTITQSDKAVTDLVEKRPDGESASENQKEIPPPEPVIEHTQHSSEATSVDTQQAAKPVSPQPDEKKIEIPKEEPVKVNKSEDLGHEEVTEKLEEPAPQEELCPQEPTKTDTTIEAEPSAAPTEQVQDTCDKTGEEKENIPETLLDTSKPGDTTSSAAETEETSKPGATTSAAAETEETNSLIEPTKCGEDGREQNVLLVQQVS